PGEPGEPAAGKPGTPGSFEPETREAYRQRHTGRARPRSPFRVGEPYPRGLIHHERGSEAMIERSLPIVFLHAFPLDSRMWSEEAERYAGRGVLTPNFPGFGG